MSEGLFDAKLMAFYDMYRIEDKKMEHWDVLETIPHQRTVEKLEWQILAGFLIRAARRRAHREIGLTNAEGKLRWYGGGPRAPEDAVQLLTWLDLSTDYLVIARWKSLFARHIEAQPLAACYEICYKDRCQVRREPHEY